MICSAFIPFSFQGAGNRATMLKDYLIFVVLSNLRKCLGESILILFQILFKVFAVILCNKSWVFQDIDRFEPAVFFVQFLEHLLIFTTPKNDNCFFLRTEGKLLNERFNHKRFYR